MVANDTHLTERRARTPIGATCAADIAFCFALLGDFTNARSWLALAERRTQGQRVAPASVGGTKALARAVLDCREGRALVSASMLDDDWPQYEATLTGSLLRPLRIVRAYARAIQGPREAGIAETQLLTMRANYAGEFDYLGAAWPEMAAFLASHQLTKPS
jgi:hypothetical protein